MRCNKDLRDHEQRPPLILGNVARLLRISTVIRARGTCNHFTRRDLFVVWIVLISSVCRMSVNPTSCRHYDESQIWFVFMLARAFQPGEFSIWIFVQSSSFILIKQISQFVKMDTEQFMNATYSILICSKSK